MDTDVAFTWEYFRVSISKGNEKRINLEIIRPGVGDDRRKWFLWVERVCWPEFHVAYYLVR